MNDNKDPQQEPANTGISSTDSVVMPQVEPPSMPVPQSPVSEIPPQASPVFQDTGSTPIGTDNTTSAQEFVPEVPQNIQTEESHAQPMPSMDSQNPQTDVPPQGSEPLTPTPITAIPQKSPFSKFKLFIIISVVAIVAIYSVVAFLYMQNQKMKGQEPESVDEISMETPQEEIIPTAAPELAPGPDTIKIVNGDIVMQPPDGSRTPRTIVSKEDFSSTGITGFAAVAVSPDTKSICFESWPPAPEPALYIASSTGEGVSEVSPNRKSCLWSPDSQKVFYTGFATSTQSVDIFSYDLPTQEETNLTVSSQAATKNTVFEIIGLSSDSTKLICTYQVGTKPASDCEIDLATMEVTLSQ